MKRNLALAALLTLLGTMLTLPAVAEEIPLARRGTLLDHVAGRWVMTGTIAGQQTTHDVTAEWVLAGHYLRLHELARETDPATGEPAYEAIVFLGWDEPTARLACLWLDVTGGGGLTNDVIGLAEPGGDELAFVFDGGDEGVIHNTWTYHRDADAWNWVIDIEQEGERSNFAKLELQRRH